MNKEKIQTPTKAKLTAKLKATRKAAARIRREKEQGIWKPPKGPALPKIRKMIENAAEDYPKLMYLVSRTEESEQLEPDPKPLHRPGLIIRPWETEAESGYNRHYLFKAKDAVWKKDKKKDKAWQKLCMIAKRIVEPVQSQYLIQSELNPEFWIDESTLYTVEKDGLYIDDEPAVRRWLKMLFNLRELRKPRCEQNMQLSGMIDVFAESVKAYDQLLEMVPKTYGQVGKSKEQVKVEAEKYNRVHGFPGVNKLTKIIGCSINTLIEAIPLSEELKAAKSAYDKANNKNTPRFTKWETTKDGETTNNYGDKRARVEPVYPEYTDEEVDILWDKAIKFRTRKGATKEQLKMAADLIREEKAGTITKRETVDYLDKESDIEYSG